jgi:hypothetical protein
MGVIACLEIEHAWIGALSKILASADLIQS